MIHLANPKDGHTSSEENLLCFARFFKSGDGSDMCINIETIGSAEWIYIFLLLLIQSQSRKL